MEATRWLRLLQGAVGLVLAGAALTTATAALAYYVGGTSTSDASRYPATKAAALGGVSGITTTGGVLQVVVSWSASAGPRTGYQVQRWSASNGGTATAVCPASATSTATSCTDSVAVGSYWYTVTPRYLVSGMASAWVGTESGRVPGVSSPPAASVTGCSPSTLAKGTSHTLTVTGAGFNPADASVDINGNGITSVTVTARSATSVTATVVIGNATANSRNVTVSSAAYGTSVQGKDCVTITG